MHARCPATSLSVEYCQRGNPEFIFYCIIQLASSLGSAENGGDVAQLVERPLSMREVQGSIPCIST